MRGANRKRGNPDFGQERFFEGGDGVSGEVVAAPSLDVLEGWMWLGGSCPLAWQGLGLPEL